MERAFVFDIILFGLFDSGLEFVKFGAPNKPIVLLSSFLFDELIKELLVFRNIFSFCIFLLSSSFFSFSLLSLFSPNKLFLITGVLMLLFWNKFLFILFLSSGDLNILFSTSLFSFLSNGNKFSLFSLLSSLVFFSAGLSKGAPNKFFFIFEPNNICCCSFFSALSNKFPNKEFFSLLLLLNKDVLILVFFSSFLLLSAGEPNNFGC